MKAKNPRVIETGYRSPQLTLWRHGSNGCSRLSLPDDTAWTKPQRNLDVIQLPLLAFDENHQQEVFS
ncbi:MAG: hypothetical protein ACJ8AG_17525 [Ktedonobacteraceae bacterium]